jgi:hypothetical protein
MKIICVLLGVIICSGLNAAEMLTNQISLHLVDPSISKSALLAGQVKVKAAKLVSQPILSDVDFISYDKTNHVFAVSVDTAKRMAERLGSASTTIISGEKYYGLSWQDTPFVLVAAGEPIYLGVLSCVTSSGDYPLPSIFPQKNLISSYSTSNVTFVITLRRGESPGLGAVNDHLDIRSDPRILASFKKLNL